MPRDPIDSNGDTPAMLCAMHGHDDCLAILLRSGSLLNARNARTGYTCAMHAASSKHANCLHVLASFGADFDVMTPSAHSAAECATKADHVESLRIIVEAGFDPDTRHRQRGKTLAHITALEGSPLALGYLIEQGADIEALDVDGLTPAGIAFHTGDPACLAILLEAGCRLDFLDIKSLNPCRFLASEQGLRACQDLLAAETERRALSEAVLASAASRSTRRI